MNLGTYDRVEFSVLRPPGYTHMAAFDELLTALSSSFAVLGLSVQMKENLIERDPHILKILVGGHLLGPDIPALPSDLILLNAEQLPPVFSVYPAYRDLLQRHVVLDYSVQNIRYLQTSGHGHVHFLPIGYVPELTRISPADPQDIDVLFYGSLVDRRRHILSELARAGLKVQALFDIYGAERDAWIARSKIVINIHAHPTKVHEIVRCSYLLANRKAVVTECDHDTEIDEAFRHAMVAVPYDRLVPACVSLIQDAPRRRALEQRGYDIFSQRPQAQALAALLPEILASVRAISNA